MMMSRKYDATGPEAEFQPGSRGRVLRNLLGITRVREMNVAETRALQTAMDRFVRRFDEQHRFTDADVQDMHRTWLGGIYEWAGEYRSVNISKEGFPFAAAARVPAPMQDFQKRVLSRRTPCRFQRREDVVEALAEAHVELVLIHPFRDGNGRIARALSILMVLQAGLPLLDFSPIAGKRRTAYFAAIQAGMDRNYGPMAGIFEELIERSLVWP
ncbi:MAG: Fic family protein [Pseudomonadota bacterium]